MIGDNRVPQSPQGNVDIDALLQAGVRLRDALGAAIAVYGDAFNPLLSVKALTYYAEGDLGTVPEAVRARLTAAAAAVDLQQLPSFEARPCLGRKRDDHGP